MSLNFLVTKILFVKFRMSDEFVELEIFTKLPNKEEIKNSGCLETIKIIFTILIFVIFAACLTLGLLGSLYLIIKILSS